MGIITSIVAGILIGWIASVRNPEAGREALIRNVTAGIIGAFAGSWILGKLFESAATGEFSFGAVIASCLGATTLLFVRARLTPG